MSTLIKADAGKLTHDNYTATNTPITRTLPHNTNTIMLANTGGFNAQVSFDGGNNFLDLGPGNVLSMDVCSLLSYIIQCPGNTTSMECLYGSEA